MALPQTTYSDRLRPAVVGMIANSRPKDVVSKIIEPAGGAGFGVPVYQGTAANQVTTTLNTKPMGVTIRDVTLVRAGGDDANVDKFKQGETAAVLREGIIWVQASVAVAVGDPVYATPAGAWTNVSNGGANAAFKGRWDSATAGIGIARVELLK